jgi:hypothetical protein
MKNGGITLFIVGSAAVIFGLIGGCNALLKYDAAKTAKWNAEAVAWNEVAFTKPTIVGTNEQGLVVKLYEYIRHGRTHYIYQIGETKTTNVIGNEGKVKITEVHAETQ